MRSGGDDVDDAGDTSVSRRLRKQVSSGVSSGCVWHLGSSSTKDTKGNE